MTANHPLLHPLRRWRQERSVSLAQMARLIGVSFPAASSYETGRRHPRPQIMARIEAVTLGAVTASDFLPPASMKSTTKSPAAVAASPAAAGVACAPPIGAAGSAAATGGGEAWDAAPGLASGDASQKDAAE